MEKYIINKGVGRPVEFKGIKAQYIAYLAAGLLGLLLLFAILYVAGVPALVCIVFVAVAGTALFTTVIRYSHRYGEHGLMKEAAWRKTLPCIRSRKRPFLLNQ
ncbi:MAG: DUF4133 domain-containing protein [Chitinophagaceae bacterium]|nr:MAG: DUF4133 domain-containing protein [Chitinophagaceae bacterium]